MLFYFIMCLQTFSLEAHIVKLHPEVSESTKKTVSDAVKEFAPRAGFSDTKDQLLILAVIKKESSFVQPRAAGSSGEWGMMQVIPEDSHIKKLALDYRCSPEETSLPSFKETLSSGEIVWHRICAGANPNIMTGSRVSPWKLSMLLKHSVRAGIAIGIMEMAFWKKKFESGLKSKYWDTETRVPASMRNWHKKVLEGLGDQVWVVHYNYGGQLKTGSMAMSYPLMIMKYMKMMED